MISTGTVSGEVAVKGTFLSKNWLALYAANDMSRVGAILERATDGLAKLKDPSSSEVEGVVVQAFQKEVQMAAANKVLSPYGLDLETFVATGRGKFGDQVFDQLRRDLEKACPSCTFLVVGFGRDKHADIFEVSVPGQASRYNEIGFWAIGSGAHSAISSLMFRKHQRSAGAAETIYHVCEAKLMAESALGVGTDTTVALLKPDAEAKYIRGSAFKHIRRRWETAGQPRVPKNIVVEIQKMLDEWKAPAKASDKVTPKK
jgi:hypothetical protein